MATFKERFVAFMDEQGIKYTDFDDRAVQLAFHSDVVPQGVRVVVIFDKENDNAVHFVSKGFVKVPESSLSAALLAVNEANAKFRWAKFYLADDSDIVAEDDAILDMNNVGQECASICFRISNIVDEAYPILMKAIYA